MGKIIYNKAFQKEIFEDPFLIFTDTSGSPGATFPINDLDGNIMASVEKGIAYYGTVSHTDLYTSDELSSELGITQGNSQDNQSVWHKYYWNGGIHFWRKAVRNEISWNTIANQGAALGTGTKRSRKNYQGGGGNSGGTTVTQDAELIKNGVTYIPRLSEAATIDKPAAGGSDMHGSEWNLIFLNLHAATNSGEYSNSPTDGVSYINWGNVVDFTNDDFVGWKTDLGDDNFNVSQISNPPGLELWQQETHDNVSNRITRGRVWASFTTARVNSQTNNFLGWSPVLTVKHPSFVTYGKSGGFNQDEPDW